MAAFSATGPGDGEEALAAWDVPEDPAGQSLELNQLAGLSPRAGAEGDKARWAQEKTARPTRPEIIGGFGDDQIRCLQARP